MSAAAASTRAEAPANLTAADIAEALGGARSGDGWAARCPAHDDTTPSLTLADRDGRVLVRCHAGCSQAAVIAALRGRGLWPQAQARDAVPARPPDHAWLYRDAGGEVVRRTVRWNVGTGKVVRPQTPDGHGGWRMGDMRGPRPLYGLADLLAQPTAPVLVAEGEPATDAVRELLPDHVAITSAGGAQAAAGTDWSPLAGRDVVVWPDADDAGTAYAADVARLAARAGAATVRVVTLPPGLLAGWDLADALPDGWTAETVREIIAKALPPIDAGAPAQDASPPLDIFGDPLLTGRPALPLEDFPASIRDFAADRAELIGNDPAAIAVPALAAVAIATGDEHRVQPQVHNTEWTEPPILRIAVVIDSGEKKTAAFRCIIEPLHEIEGEWFAEDASVRQRHEMEQRRFKKQAEAWARTGIGPPPEEPQRPPQRQKLIEDCTAEKAALICADNPCGIGSIQDELSGWFGSFDAYKSHGGKDRPFWLRSYDGGSLLIGRVQGGRIHVLNASVSIVGSIQPGPLRRLAGKITDDGLIQRFLTVFPSPSTRGVDRVPNHAATRRYARLLRNLVALPAPAGPYRLSAEAQTERLLVSTVAEHAAVLPSTSEAFRAHLRKWDGFFARLALVWHLAEHDGVNPPQIIGAETARRVARFMIDYLLHHSARFYSEVLGDEQCADVRWIAGHILAQRLDKISARDLGRVYHGIRGDLRRIGAAMDALALANWVTPAESNRPGAPLSRWRVNPAVHALFADRAEAERQRREHVRQRIAEAAAALGGKGDE